MSKTLVIVIIFYFSLDQVPVQTPDHKTQSPLTLPVSLYSIIV